MRGRYKVCTKPQWISQFFQNFSSQDILSPILPAIKFWEKFHPTIIIYTYFVWMKIKKILLKNRKSLLNLGEFSKFLEE